MEQIVIWVILGFLGLCMGSFAGATVWRLRARQLVEDKAEGEKIDNKEYKQLLPLTKVTTTTDRSQCLHCGHALEWYDLFPLISWISTRGKCRYCHMPIGWFEPLIELGTAIIFVGSYILWPEGLQNTTQVLQFGIWLVACVLLVILFAYDTKWFLLPNQIVFPLIAVAGISALIHVVTSHVTVDTIANIVIAITILSGLYLFLWHVSKGEWIGFGDIKLGLALALLLSSWPLAFITLLAANLIGCFIVIPGLITKKMTRTSHVPFGPLLIVGFFIAKFFGWAIIGWYVTVSIPL